MSDFLEQMAATSAARASRLPSVYRADDGAQPAYPLTLSRFDLIAEIKNRSPAEGQLSGDTGDIAARARLYAKAGAAAISVLTEPERFDGALEHLEIAVDAVAEYRVPVMRKDFLVSTSQVHEARAAGASGVLLIVAMLDDRTLRDSLDTALDLGMFALVEAFDAADVARMNALLEEDHFLQAARGARLLAGINTRNLRTLEVEPDRLRVLGNALPRETINVAESGIKDASDAKMAADNGYSMALVGTALMRAEDPAKLIADMLTAGRAA